MSAQGVLRYGDEAAEFIARIDDPVTRNLVNMAFVAFVKRVHLEKRDAPRCDLDLLYLAQVLKEFFSEHEVLARTLEGQRVGAWFPEGE